MSGNDGRRNSFSLGLFGLTSLAALALRLAYLFQVRGTTLFEAVLRDSRFYVERAGEILGGGFIGSAVSFHSAPLYPYFLALLMGPGGQDGLWWVRLAQALASALTAGMLALTAQRLFDRWSGVATGLLAVLYAPFLFYSGELLEITLSLFFLAGAFLLLSRDDEPAGGRLFASGLLLGLAALGKPNLLVLGPVLLLTLGLLRLRGWKRWPRFALLVAGILVAVLPFTFRNKLAGDDWVLISSNGGINLFIGNNPQATGGFRVPSAMQWDLEAASREVAERAEGRELKPSEVSDFWYGRARAYFKQRPGEATLLLGRKALLLLNRYEIPNHYNFYFFREYYSSILKWDLVGWALLMPLGIFGLMVGARKGAAARRAAWSLLALSLSVVLFFVTSRYRLPAVLLLFPFAGLGLASLGRLVLARSWRALALALVLLTAGSALANLPIVGHADFHDDFLVLNDYWAQRQDWPKAKQYSIQALRENMNSAAAWQNLGYACLELAELDRAEQSLWKAVELDPTLAHAYGNLAALYLNNNRPLLARACLEKAEALDPLLVSRLADVRRMIPAALADWDEIGRRSLERIDGDLAAAPGDAHLLKEKAEVLGFRLERHDEALAVLDSVPREALAADPRLREDLALMRSRIVTARDHMRYLDME